MSTGWWRPAARTVRRALRVARGTLANGLHMLRGRASQTPSRPIVLDAYTFQEPDSGITRLWRPVLAEWAASGFSQDILLVDRGGSAPQLPGFAYERAPVRADANVQAERSLLDGVCRRAGARLFCSTQYSYPGTFPSFLVAHDLTPEVLGWDLSAPVWRDKAAAIARADAYACISESTQRDLHRIYPVTKGRPSTVVLLGVGEEFRPAPADAVAALRERFGLPESYYVFVGHRDIHKNAELVFDALRHFPEPRGFGLLLVGGASQLEARFAEAAGSTPAIVARLTDEELVAAYTGAAALLFPSRYEGFGLVILEAMACGCPVITCRNSALPEAAGDAAIYVGEDDAEGLALAMRHVVEPGARARLVQAGFERSAGFTWEKTARQLADALSQAAGL